MKAATLLVVWALLLYSCKEVSYREPQPSAVDPLKEVPVNLVGHYVGIDEKGADTDTLIIETWGYHFRDTQDKEWLGKGTLSDSLVVKFYANYYFVNFRIRDQWVLRLIKQKSSGDFEFLSINISDDNKRSAVLKKISKRMTFKEIRYKDDTFYQISPTKEQLMQLIKEGYFTGNVLSKVK